MYFCKNAVIEKARLAHNSIISGTLYSHLLHCDFCVSYAILMEAYRGSGIKRIRFYNGA